MRATIDIYTLMKYLPVFNYFITADARENIHRVVCIAQGINKLGAQLWKTTCVVTKCRYNCKEMLARVL